MELIIQKAVELGVSEIVPVAMARSVVKLDEKKATAKVKRWQTISEAAAKQSKRGIIPQVQNVMSYKAAMSYAKDIDVKLLPYELAEGMEKTKALIETIKPGQKIAIFIGPEGGFAAEEVELAKEGNFEIITLGKRILRTETAGMTLLSILMYQLEQ
jgi:16S rRNA (uracil1498-N3)-methyltransferase